MGAAICRAGDGIRTREYQLGRLMPYRLATPARLHSNMGTLEQRQAEVVVVRAGALHGQRPLPTIGALQLHPAEDIEVTHQVLWPASNQPLAGLQLLHEPLAVEEFQVPPDGPPPRVAAGQAEPLAVWSVSRRHQHDVDLLAGDGAALPPHRNSCGQLWSVGVGGLEPPTSASQTRRATDCATPRTTTGTILQSQSPEPSPGVQSGEFPDVHPSESLLPSAGSRIRQRQRDAFAALRTGPTPGGHRPDRA